MSERPPASLDGRAAMPASSFLDQVGKIGLDDLLARVEGSPAVTRELTRARRQIAACAAQVFATDEGRVVLEFLFDATLRRPVFMPGLGPEGLVYAAHREGQNAVVWQIVQAIAEGRCEIPPNREGV